MRKSVKISLIALALLIALAAVAVWLVIDNLDRLVTDAIEETGSDATGTAVGVDGLHIALRDATGEIGGLVIENPGGFEPGDAIRFEGIRLVLDPATLFKDTIRVRELHVDAAEVNLEQKNGAQTNLQTLIDHISDYTGPADEEAAAKTRNVVIDEFVLDKARVRLRSELLGNGELDLPRIRATNVGSDSPGATAADALEEILRPIVAKALDEAKARAIETGRERLQKEMDERVQGLIKDKVGG